MGFRVGMVDEIRDVKTLAHQAALHVHQCHQHRVHLAFGGQVLERVESKVAHLQTSLLM